MLRKDCKQNSPFITSPLIFSFPDMNNDCAFALPETSLPKFSSDRLRVTVARCQHLLAKQSLPSLCRRRSTLACSSPFAFLPAGASPFATSPFSLRSMCQLSVWPEAFFKVKAKMALPFLMASFRSASFDLSESLMMSKATDDGKASANG